MSKICSHTNRRKIAIMRQMFKWIFDYEDSVSKFAFIPGKRKLLFNQKEQSIHDIDETGSR